VGRSFRRRYRGHLRSAGPGHRPKVVGAIAPRLEQAEIERAKRKPTESLNAYAYYLRGMASLHQWTRESSDEALRLFRRAGSLFLCRWRPALQPTPRGADVAYCKPREAKNS
jgi:hypothetical protein